MGNISPADMTFCLLAQFHDLLVEKSSKNKIGLSSNIPQKIFWSQELPEASACRTFGPRWREAPRPRSQNLQHQACLPSSSAEVICLFLSLFSRSMTHLQNLWFLFSLKKGNCHHSNLTANLSHNWCCKKEIETRNRLCTFLSFPLCFLEFVFCRLVCLYSSVWKVESRTKHDRRRHGRCTSCTSVHTLWPTLPPSFAPPTCISFQLLDWVMLFCTLNLCFDQSLFEQWLVILYDRH